MPVPGFIITIIWPAVSDHTVAEASSYPLARFTRLSYFTHISIDSYDRTSINQPRNNGYGGEKKTVSPLFFMSLPTISNDNLTNRILRTHRLVMIFFSKSSHGLELFSSYTPEPTHISTTWRQCQLHLAAHDDVIKWKHFPRYWPFVRGIHRWPVNSPHKGQWRRALMFSLICARINGWISNREAGDLRRYRAHYDVTVML